MPYAGRKDLGDDAVREFFRQRNFRDEMDFRKGRARADDEQTAARLKFAQEESSRRASRDDVQLALQNRSLGLSEQRIGLDRQQEARQQATFETGQAAYTEGKVKQRSAEQAQYAGMREKAKALFTVHPELVQDFQGAQRYLEGAKDLGPDAKALFLETFVEGMKEKVGALNKQKSRAAFNDMRSTGKLNSVAGDTAEADLLAQQHENGDISDAMFAQGTQKLLKQQTDRKTEAQRMEAVAANWQQRVASSGAPQGSKMWVDLQQIGNEVVAGSRTYESAVEDFDRMTNPAAAGMGPKPDDVLKWATALHNEATMRDPAAKLEDSIAKAQQLLGGKPAAGVENPTGPDAPVKSEADKERELRGGLHMPEGGMKAGLRKAFPGKGPAQTQDELDAFAKDWRAKNPKGTPEQLKAAWAKVSGG